MKGKCTARQCGHLDTSWVALECVDKQNEIRDEDFGKVLTRLFWSGSSGQWPPPVLVTAAAPPFVPSWPCARREEGLFLVMVGGWMGMGGFSGVTALYSRGS